MNLCNPIIKTSSLRISVTNNYITTIKLMGANKPSSQPTPSWHNRASKNTAIPNSRE